MTRSVTLTIPGDPVAKGRPRVSVKNGVARGYTPARTVDYENTIGTHWLALEPADRRMFRGDVGIVLRVREDSPHPADLDNYVKIALDALNNLAWPDDKQVTSIVAVIERQHPEPSLRITITEEETRGD